ncbi:methionyl-tRNA formyltransferase [Nafulsella turpanensis]|uniref:methionyl-tRNA formyltransferase n=1 Tax=Nafulsella turpanensis TaxID=1265690 RepID=UPI0003468C03|nr:methionyl-tRNA formyltransferase [Nafulsella turpanensis]
MKKDLRIIFMGTPDFAVPSLQILVENDYKVVAVVTAPDRPKGRGQKVIPSPVKEYAVSQNLPVLQPTNLKSPDFQAELKALEANLQIVVAFRMLPEAVWSMPEIGTFNLHASLLPKYRGAAPINWAIIKGEKETGITTFFLQHEIDTGHILFQEKEPILPDDTAGSLYERLMHKGAKLVLKTVQAIEQDDYHPKPQADTAATHAPKIFKETCQIDWQKPGAEIQNFIRGLSPYPAAWMELNGQHCKVFATSLKGDKGTEKEAGEVVTDNKSFIAVKGKDELIYLDEIQLQGKKRMPVADFLRGNQL